MEQYAYDIEVYNNFFSATFVSMNSKYDEYIKEYLYYKSKKDTLNKKRLLEKMDVLVFVINSETNDAFRLRDFLSIKCVLYGFNNFDYDDIVINRLMDIVSEDSKDINAILYGTSTELIYTKYISFDHDLYKYKFNKPFVSIDLKKLYHLGYKGLKMVAITMKYPFINDLPISPEKGVNLEDIDLLLEYNLNDVLMTRQMLKLKKDELQSRIDSVAIYKIDERSLSSSRPELAKAIVSSYIQKLNGGDKSFEKGRTYRKFIQFKDIVIHFEFEKPEFKSFYNKLKNFKLLIGSNSFDETFKYNNVEYKFGVGGLHTKDRPKIYIEDDEFVIVDVDADSYYPNFIISHDIEPSHLKGFFIPIYKLITETRLKAKKAGKVKLDDKTIENFKELIDNKIKNKKLANILKIVINSSFGQFNDTYSFLYDPFALYKTTVNGQIGLLYVAEKIILMGGEILSVNTDGIVSKIKRKDLKLYQETAKKAFADFKATCEFTFYKKYVRTSVNDYVTIKTNGEHKLKGDFEFDKLNLHDGYSKGFDMPIVAKALVEYFINNIPIKTTIENERDIYNFCKSSNIGNQFRLFKTYVKNGKIIKEEISKHVRYYVSRTGASLVKEDWNSHRNTQLVAKRSVTIFNDYFSKNNFNDYNINYGYYITEANKLINKIEKRDTKSIKKYGGTLFD